MAISVEAEYTPAGPGAGTDVVMTLTGALENDVVVIFGGHGDNEPTIGAPSGWTEIRQFAATNLILIAFYKVMGSTPDVSVTCEGGGAAGDGVTYVGYLLRGADTSTPLDAVAVSATGGPNFPDSPSITTVTDDAYVFSAGFGDTVDPSITAPTGYSVAALVTANGPTKDITTGVSYKLIATAGAEDPAAYAAWGCNNWGAMTVAIRPDSGGPPVGVTVGFSNGSAVTAEGAVRVVVVAADYAEQAGDIYIDGTRHTSAGLMYTTTDAVDGSETLINGIAHSSVGVRYIQTGDTTNKWPEGFATDADGRQAYATSLTASSSIRGIARESDGAVLLNS